MSVTQWYIQKQTKEKSVIPQFWQYIYKNTIEKRQVGSLLDYLCIWSGTSSLLLQADGHLGRGGGASQESHLVELRVGSVRPTGRVAGRCKGVKGWRDRRGDRVAARPSLSLSVAWRGRCHHRGGGGGVPGFRSGDVPLAEWAGVFDFQPGVHAVLVEFVSATSKGYSWHDWTLDGWREWLHFLHEYSHSYCLELPAMTRHMHAKIRQVVVICI
jgi:hypothetical protein